jgi:hypothetical protein
MGDFNAVNNPIVDRTSNRPETKKQSKENWKPEIPLFPYLEDLDFVDIQKDWEEITSNFTKPSHTWKNKEASSRIDYIWITQDLITNSIYSFNNRDYEYITNSDHTLLQVSFYKKDIVNLPKEAAIRKRGSRTILDLKKMAKEDWLNYAQKIETEIVQHKLLDKIQKTKEEKYGNNKTSTNSLQKIFNEFEKIKFQMLNQNHFLNHFLI